MAIVSFDVPPILRAALRVAWIEYRPTVPLTSLILIV